MNILIVEDESHSSRKLIKLLEEIDSSIRIENCLESIDASIKWLKNHSMPDLIFMDIQLSDGLCFEIFKQIDIRIPVIFVTAYDEYALEAFKVNSIDYLLKPIDKDELTRSLQKLDELKNHQITGINEKIEKLMYNLGETTNSYKSRFLIKSGQALITIFDKDIAYFVSDRKLTLLVTHDGKKHPMDETLEVLENQTNPHQFFRVNRQFLTNIESIMSIHKFFNGKLKIHLKPPPEHEVIISRDKVKTFKEWLNK